MTVKLGTKLPRNEDRNGLHVILRALLHDPYRPHLAIVVLEPSKITRDLDADDVVPTVVVRAIEPITASEDIGRLRAMLQRAHEECTGDLELPADWEAVLSGMASPTLPGTEPGAGR